MDFETIITILIVSIIVVFQLLKRLFSAKTAASGKVPAWKQKLDGALSQIREELKTEMAGDSPEPAYRDHIVPEAEPETVAVTPPKRDYRAERISRMEELSAPKTDEQKEEVDVGFMDLQQAIIWSEILAPPLALRNERGEIIKPIRHTE